MIREHLTGLDIKNLRLTSRRFKDDVKLRIDRVFISPNQADLDFIYAFSREHGFKDMVKEIVWDDARYYAPWGYEDDFIVRDIQFTQSCLATAMDESMDFRLGKKPRDSPKDYEFSLDDHCLPVEVRTTLFKADTLMSRHLATFDARYNDLSETCREYRNVFQEAEALRRAGADALALKYALSAFPNVRSIRHVCHDWKPWTIHPEYRSPLHRGLPPTVRAPSEESSKYHTLARFMQARRDGVDELAELVGSLYRGLEIIPKALMAIPHPKIEEYIMDTASSGFGVPLNATGLSVSNMFRHLPLKRLKLAISPAILSRAVSYETLSPQTVLMTPDLILDFPPFLEYLDLNFNDAADKKLLERHCRLYWQSQCPVSAKIVKATEDTDVAESVD